LSGRTTTGDPEGKVLEERERPSPEELERRLAALRGEVELRVPAASAVKVGGERAYRLHRRGEEGEMPLRRSTIHSLDLVSYDGSSAVLDLLVGSGTYVRSIADEIGGHCPTLGRTEVGPVHLGAADRG